MLQNAIPSSLWRAALFTEAPVPMALCDLGGRFVDCNERFANLVGYARAELYVHTWQSITHRDDIAGDEAACQQLLNAGAVEDSYQICKRYIRKNGDPVWVNAHVARVRDHDQKVLCFLHHAVPLVSGAAQVATSQRVPDQHIEVRPSLSWIELIKQNPKESIIAGLGITLIFGKEWVKEVINLWLR